MDFSSERIDKPQKSKIPEEVIEKALLSAQTGNSGTFENIPEESGTVENVPAGKDRKGKESKGEDGSITRTREEPPRPESENFKKFKAWIDANAPNVGKLKEPFTEAQFERIKQAIPPSMLEGNHNRMLALSQSTQVYWH